MFALFAILAGFVAGTFSGLLGIGGGIIMLPVLRLAFGLPALETTATSLFFTCPTAVSSMAGHLRRHTSIYKLGAVVGVAGACASPAGSLFSNVAGPLVTMVCAAVVIIYTAVRMLRQGLAMPGRTQLSAQEAQVGASSPHVHAPAAERTVDVTVLPGRGSGARRLAVPLVGGAAAGFLSGFLGVGGGFLIVPLLVWAFKLPMRYAAGTSAVAMTMLSIPGVVTHALMGDVHWLLGLLLICGSIPGAQLGARLASRVPEKQLRIVFGCVLVFGGVMLAANEAGLL